MLPQTAWLGLEAFKKGLLLAASDSYKFLGS